jgi:ketosteroid isomerase-like protein
MTTINDLDDFKALEPFFRIIQQGLAGLADGERFFDLLAEDVVFECASQGRAVATGAPYANRYISVLTIADRKVTRWRDYLDPVAVFNALGWPSP